MRVLQISASYKPAFIYGGPTMSVSMLAEQLVKGGIFVNVFTTTANGMNELPIQTNEPLVVDGVNTIYFKRLTKDHTHFSPRLLLTVWKKAKDFDLIHIHAWWNMVSILSCLIAIMRNVPVVVSPRGMLSNYSFNNKNNSIKKLIHNLLTKPLLKKCFIHTTSVNEYAAVEKTVRPKAIFNIPNFIKLSESKNHADDVPVNYLKLIFLSRIEEKKGLDILLNALKTVTIPYKLTVAGDGNADYVAGLKELALKNNIDKNISWIGFQSDNKFELLYRHDLMVLPSHDENFGNVVIESLSVGTAVLISENVGLADYVAAYNWGWVCKTSATSLSETIEKISGEKNTLQEIRKTAPAGILNNFNETNLVKRYIDMYNTILQS